MSLKFFRKIILAVSLFWLLTAVGFSQTAESVSSDSLQPDTTLSFYTITEIATDSTSQTGTFKPWLLPLGIAVATGTAIFLLFSVRSR